MATSALARLLVAVGMFERPQVPAAAYLAAAGLLSCAAQLLLCIDAFPLIFVGCGAPAAPPRGPATAAHAPRAPPPRAVAALAPPSVHSP